MMTKNNAGILANMALSPTLTKRVRSPGLEPLNRYELQAIENLFAWVAEDQGAAPEIVRSMTEASFGADDVGAIPRKDYDEVIRFLLDLRLNDVRN
jgi:hypothetical protein